MGMEITTDRLFQIIGAQRVEIIVLQEQLRAAQAHQCAAPAPAKK